MANKKVEIMIDDVRLVAELYVDDAPIICNMILNNPGILPSQEPALFPVRSRD